MANGKNRLFWLTSLAISSIPLAVTFYGVYSDRRWITILSFVVFIIFLLLSTCTFLSWKTFKFSTPIILQFLRALSVVLTPLAHLLRGIPVLGKVTNGLIKLVFWSWFIVLMCSDVLVRKLLKTFVGLHEPSTGQYSLVNACDTNFQPCGEFGKVLDKEKVQRIEEGGADFARDHDYGDPKPSQRRVEFDDVQQPNQEYQLKSRRSKERPKSMDYSKYKTPGPEGSDLSRMTSNDWARALEVTGIDKYRLSLDNDPESWESLDSGHDKEERRLEDALGSHAFHDSTLSSKPVMDRPQYSQPIATTLAMVSKLVYENVPIIRHELELSGYDLHSFRAIAYRNTCGFIVQKGRNIVLVFRGTDPLNLQHAWTDIQSRLIPIQTLKEPYVPLGKCHQGMYNALGKADDFLLPSEQLAQQQRDKSQLRHRRRDSLTTDGGGTDEYIDDNDSLGTEQALPRRRSKMSPASSFRSEASKGIVSLELSNKSIYQTIATSIRAAYILIRFLVVGLFTHVSDPVDYRFAGEVRDLSAFAQACRWVDGLRLEHAEKEFYRMAKTERTKLLSRHRGSISPGDRQPSRSHSFGNEYSQDELEYLEDTNEDRNISGVRRRPSIPGQGSSRPALVKRLSSTGSHSFSATSTSRHHRRRLSGHGYDYREGKAYQSAASWQDIGNSILDIYNSQHRGDQDRKKKQLRFYICGHSLGGALATIFLAKMVQCNSPLLDIFSGLYTYGCPRVGDKDFSHTFGPKLACKMFHHVHNNDIVSRVPFWGTFETPPGTLVFIDTSRKLILYPPDPETLMPVPVRGISFMHLSGILNVRVIMRMRRESWLRILERIVLPFFLNDHFPGDYVKALAEGKIEIVEPQGQTLLFGGVDEIEKGSRAAKNGAIWMESQEGGAGKKAAVLRLTTIAAMEVVVLA
ncbi:hypothetical protein BGW38_005359 [Lunasporangiospora selenospora]|uniref:Fungal lipase-type domain-containing protein n=1 Tax=Lunasporangiospora selenospora TaxID=979761 RepID=A0A9P6KI56_9FUNG|nr:hypothetical protein BGW38_005359 [Lunasporangiospora selenospora]